WITRQHLLEAPDRLERATCHRQTDHEWPLGTSPDHRRRGYLQRVGLDAHVLAAHARLDHDEPCVHEHRHVQLVGPWEHHDLDAALEVLDRDRRPAVALLAHAPLHTGDEATDAHGAAVRALGVGEELAHRAVAAGPQDVLEPLQRMI